MRRQPAYGGVRIRRYPHPALAVAAAGLLTACLATPGAEAPAQGATAAGNHSGGTPGQRAAALVARMTLDEKISQLHTTGAGVGGIARLVPGIPRLGIPDLAISNGPAGVGTGSVPTQPDATALPAPVALAASFDTSLAHEYGVVEGRETGDVGHNLLEAPDVNIVRVPQSGRAFENYGEDPYLAGHLAAANISGIQSQGVLAEVKHYTANDQETNRSTINEVIDDRTLHEIDLPAFQDAVDANVAAVMCAYPSVNGHFMCENQHLISDVLRGRWGFDGFVQSDASATHSAVGSALAGQDLELRDNGPYDQTIKQAVLDGQLPERVIDTLIERRLATEIRFGLFDDPAGVRPIDAAADGAVARRVEEQSAVLLRNDRQTLPLDPDALRSVAVIGPYGGAADTGGGGSSHVDPLYTVSPVDGIRNVVGPDVTVTYTPGDDPAAAQAVDAAKAADVAVVMVGDVEAEGSDRANLSLPGSQDQLVSAVAAANPHTIVVLKSGAPVLMPWLDHVPAVLEAWYPGEEDGNAVADLLFGRANPSGKLPVTFPRGESQTPASTRGRWPGANGNVHYGEGLDVGYRWYDAQGLGPLFPFGYGLSYTTFAFRHLTVTRTLSPNGTVRVGVDVTNTGHRAGAEVAQVYVTDPAAAGEPPRQLKGFQKVTLAAGQTKHLTFTLDDRAFAVWDADAQRWATVDGRYTVSVGDSSRNLPLHAAVAVPRAWGTRALSPPFPPPSSTVARPRWSPPPPAAPATPR